MLTIWWLSRQKCWQWLSTFQKFNSVVVSLLRDRAVENPESARSVIYAIFSAHSAYFNVSRQKVPYFNVSRQKVPYFNVLRQNRVVFNCFATKQCWGMLKMWGQPLSGSLWLALLLSLAPSCSLLLSQAPYCSPNLRTTSSLGSQGPCSARSGAAALQHFRLLCPRPKSVLNLT